MSPPLRQTLAAVTLLVTALIDEPAVAGESSVPVTLEWVAPPSCPGRDAILARVGATLRGSPNTPHPVVARAEVSQRSTRWHVELVTTIDGSRGVRSFDSDSCESIANATAFALALAVDPNASPAPIKPVTDAPKSSTETSEPSSSTPKGAPLTSGEPSTEGAPHDEARAEPAPAAPAAKALVDKPTPSRDSHASSAQRSGRFARFGVGAGAMLDTATLPMPAPGAELALLWRPTPVRVEVAGVLVPTQRTAIGPVAGASGAFGLWGVATRGCFAPTLGLFELGPCVGAELDAVSASGSGAVLARGLSDTAIWGTVETSGAAALMLSPFALRLSVGAAFPLARPEFVLVSAASGGDQVIHRASFASFRGHFSAEIYFDGPRAHRALPSQPR